MTTTTLAAHTKSPAVPMRRSVARPFGLASARTAGNRAGGRHRCGRPRTVHLVDLENLLAGRVDTAAVTEVWAEYRQVTGMRWDDHVIVAVSKKHAAATFFALPDAVQRIVGRNIPDGADHALLDTIDVDWVARRFGQVMVATGDNIFTGVAARLHAQGLQVVQVIGGGLTATGLYRQCPTQLYLTAAQHHVQTRRHATLAAVMAAETVSHTG